VLLYRSCAVATPSTAASTTVEPAPARPRGRLTSLLLQLFSRSGSARRAVDTAPSEAKATDGSDDDDDDDNGEDDVTAVLRGDAADSKTRDEDEREEKGDDDESDDLDDLDDDGIDAGVDLHDTSEGARTKIGLTAWKLRWANAQRYENRCCAAIALRFV
jgi:hypothetical protein